MSDRQDSKRSIFRTEAVRRYVESREKSVLPRLISPPTFLYLWSLLGILAASSAIAWWVKIPIYASGLALVTRSPAEGKEQQPVVVALFPPQYITKLRINQKLFLKFDRAGERRFQLFILKAEIRRPNAIAKQFALNHSTIPALDRPMVVVTARWKPLPTELPTDYLGSPGRAEVEIGQAPAISLLPTMAELFAP